MTKRGGLGRGLDALIPAKRSESAGSDINKKENDQKKTVGSGKKKETSSGKKKTSQNTSSKPSKDNNESDSNGISLEARKMADAILSGTDSVIDEKNPEEVMDTDLVNSNTSTNIKADDLSSTEEADESEDIQTEAAVSERIDEEVHDETETDSDISSETVPNADLTERTVSAESIETENTKKTDTAGNIGKPDGEIVQMRLSLVEPNRDQPRKYFDEDAINELADSIKQFGIISPLLVQKKEDYYEIIAGERRWRAAKKAGLKEVPVIIREFSSQEAVEISLIENIQREDLNPIEEAKAYERLVSEYGLGQEEVAGRVSKSRSAVANSMRLLKLGPDVQKKVETGELSEGHARTLIPLGAPELQRQIAEQIIKEKLSVRQTEKLVKDLLNPGQRTVKKRDERRETLLLSLSENLKSALGTKVNIKQSGKNKGKIEIEYYSDEELDRLYELLRAIH